MRYLMPAMLKTARPSLRMLALAIVRSFHVRGHHPVSSPDLRHRSGQFFAIEGARVEGGDVREVTSWDQPTMTQLDGGLLRMLARETSQSGVEFLLQAIAECGNIDVLKLGPSIQNIWPNIRRAHAGKRPPMI